jgi:hypothetical protein
MPPHQPLVNSLGNPESPVAAFVQVLGPSKDDDARLIRKANRRVTVLRDKPVIAATS